MRARSVLSFVVLGVFSLSLAATSKPSESGEGGVTDGFSPAVPYVAIRAASSAPIPATPCSNALLETTLKTIKAALTYPPTDVHEIELIDGPVAAGMSVTAPRENHPDDGWRFINSSYVKDLYPTSWSVSEQTESNNTSHIRSVAAHPLFIVVRADVRVLQKVNANDTFSEGRLSGKLVVSRIDTGASVCAIPFSAASSSSVKFKDHGITGKSFERAISDDMHDQVRAAIRAAGASVIPSFKIDVGL